MATLLAIETSPRLDQSTSRKLTAEFVEAWKKAHPGGATVTRDLTKTDLPFVGPLWISGAYTPVGQRSPEMAQALKISDELIAELKGVDHIVIGTPMYNFSVPAVLKAYIDHVVRVGVTFTPQYQGLVTGKKATVIMTAGGDYAPGSATESYNLATGYMRQILGFIGITDVTVVLAGRTTAIDKGETTAADFIRQFEPELAAATNG